MKANHSSELRTKTDLLNFDHMTTDSCSTETILTTDHHSIVATLFSVAISWQLNAAPYLCGVSTNKERDHAISLVH